MTDETHPRHTHARTTKKGTSKTVLVVPKAPIDNVRVLLTLEGFTGPSEVGILPAGVVDPLAPRFPSPPQGVRPRHHSGFEGPRSR